MKLLIATRNPGKADEMALYLDGMGIELITPELVGVGSFEPEETGATFLENATLKAVGYGHKAGVLTVADDSGLEVDALEGQPGVQSKRFYQGTDADRNNYLLEKLKNVSNRAARFITVLVLYNPQTKEKKSFTGVLEGHIANESAGSYGFGYDPIFVPQGQFSTLAELTIEQKNQISHRSVALKQLQTYFLDWSTHVK